MNQEYTYTEKAYRKLEHLCVVRYKEKYRDDATTGIYTRIEKELEAIKKKGTAPLFIVVYEALCGVNANPKKFCLRGCTGASVVVYLLGLTEIDPIHVSPKLYSEFCYGINGDKRVSIEINVTEELYKNLVQYFDEYMGEARIRYKHYGGGKPTKVGISDPCIMLSDSNFDDNEFSFGFIEMKIRQKKLGKKLLTGDVFDIVCPSSFNDIVKCAGLSFSDINGVWENNAEELINSSEVEFGELISHREDVYEYLLNHGIEKKKAYEITEDVEWGRIKRKGWDVETAGLLYLHGIPEWYMKSCEKIQYLPPRAHSMMFLKHYVINKNILNN